MYEPRFHRLYAGVILIGIGAAIHIATGPSAAVALIVSLGVLITFTGYERGDTK